MLAPLADAMVARCDVDAARMAVVGLGRGGYGVLRALAHEHRFAAAVLEPPIADLSTAWLRLLPAASAVARRAAATPPRWSASSACSSCSRPGLTAQLRAAGAPFDRDGTWSGVLRALAAHRLGDDVERIRTPLLLVEHADERRWPGQTDAVAGAAARPPRIVRIAAPAAGPAAPRTTRSHRPSATRACSTGSTDHLQRPTPLIASIHAPHRRPRLEHAGTNHQRCDMAAPGTHARSSSASERRGRPARCPGVRHLGRRGVGKSRLAREAVAAAEREGAMVGWVQATRSAAAIPLAAFADLLPADVRSDDLLELMRRSAAALRGRADGRPIVIGVDDAQSLDPTSAALVLQLA